MSSNEDNNSSSSHSPLPKKIRKLWKSDFNKQVPRSTYYRWQRKLRLSQDFHDNSSIERPEADGNNRRKFESASSSSSSSSDDETRKCDTGNKGGSEVRELDNDINSSVHEGHTEIVGVENNTSSSDHDNHSEAEDDIGSLDHDNVSESENDIGSSDHDNVSESENDIGSSDYDNHIVAEDDIDSSVHNNHTEVDDDRESSDLDDSTKSSDVDDSGVECNDHSDVESCRSMVDDITKLHDSSEISLIRSVLLILNFYVTHKLSKSSLRVLLNILQEILPHPNKMPRTLHHLFKFVENAAVSIRRIKHYYCKKCLHYNGSKIQIAVCSSCSSTERFSFLNEVDIIDLLKYMFEKRNLWSMLCRSNDEVGVISDITHVEYLRVNSNRKEYDLTLIMNTDGISLVKSSKSHCWPLMFMIAELPKHLRESFICIIGLWYDSNQKPVMNTFLQPFCEKLVQCFYKGITWVHPITKEKCTSRIIVPLFIADAPARAEIQKIMYLSGRYGCNICEVKSLRCRRIEGKRRTRAYIFRERSANLRNGARMETQALQAENNNFRAVRGVKGLSFVSALPLIDLRTCVLSEYMHSVLLGVGNQFINLLINQRATGISNNVLRK